MAFNQIGSLSPFGAPVIQRKVIANSLALGVGDSVKLASGFIAAGTAGALVYGHCLEFGTNKGMPVSSTGVAGAAFGSYVGAYTTASDNQTVAMVRADVDISKLTLWSGEMSAAIGTTTGSNLSGYFLDLTDKDTLNEGSAATTTCQYATDGVDPRNTAQAAVLIFESQIMGV